MINIKWTSTLIFSLALVLLVLLSMGLFTIYSISQSSKDDFFWESKDEAEYHVMVFLDASNQAYGDTFEQGIQQASEQHRIATEIIRIDGKNYDEDILDSLDMALYAKVDGIIIHAISSEALINKINLIHSKGIPVFTLNEDLSKSDRIAYIGVNRYNIGQVAAEILAENMGGSGKIAVVEQKGYDHLENKNENMLLIGLNDALLAHKDLYLELVRYTEQGVLSAEIAATEIFRKDKEIAGVFCTDGQNTLGIAQVLIDNNLVNDAVIIGYGDDEEILNYIQKGNIIEASIIADYEDIGKKALNTFYTYKKMSAVSNYVDITLQVVDEENVDAYLMRKSDGDDQGK